MSEAFQPMSKERWGQYKGLKKCMAVVAIAASIFDAYSIHNLYTGYKDNQKETTVVSDPECITFAERADFYDMSGAEACRQELRGRVAVIDLRTDSDADPSSDAFAQATSEELKYDSSGYLAPTLERVDVAPEVLEAIDGSECDPYVNGAADNVAYFQGDDLRERGYDKVLVVTPLQSCNEGLLGYAETNRGIATVSAVMGTSIMRPDQLVRIAQHELAHLYGIGHSSVLHDKQRQELVLDEYMYEHPRFQTSIDVATLVDGARIDEYGDSSMYSTQYIGGDGAIMGTPSILNETWDSFSDYQVQLLSESYGISGDPSADSEPVVISAEDGDTVPISTTIGSVEVHGFEQYNRLVVYPLESPDGYFRAAEASLASAGGNTLLLGKVFLKDYSEEGQLIPQEQAYTFVGSEAATTIYFEGGSITVSRTALS